jgi:O-succinylbenzoic acid--CoA ligase
MGLTLTIVAKHSLHAVLLNGPADAIRLVEPLRAALDGSGPALLPLDAADPRLPALLDAYAPDQVTDGDGDVTRRNGGGGVSEDTAVIVSTSGSTGTPKGVELSAGALLNSARASLARIGARPGERWLCCLPANHVAGLQVLIRSIVGGTEPVWGEGAVGGGDDYSHVSLVPTQLRRLVDAGGPLDRGGTILLGGAAAAGPLLEAARAAGARVVTTYGMSETCGGCVYDGYPLDGVSVSLDDERLVIDGPVLFSGYSGQPRRTGPFVTSDLGYVDKTGFVEVRGRADDVINTGGYKVVPGEVARALETCPGVQEVVVVGGPDQKWGERVIAIVIPADRRDPPDVKLLRTHASGVLPRYAFPSEVALVDTLPLLPSGKPDLARLRREHSPAKSVTN